MKTSNFTMVEKFLDEANLTLSNKKRVTSDVKGNLGDVMDKLLKSEAFGVGAVGTSVAAGGIASVGLLSALGSVAGLSAAGITSGLAAAGALVGGGMVTGIGVLAAPVVILGIGTYAVTNNVRNKKIDQEKEALIQEILITHEQLIQALNNEHSFSRKRKQHIAMLADILLGAKKDLEEMK